MAVYVFEINRCSNSHLRTAKTKMEVSRGVYNDQKCYAQVRSLVPRNGRP